MAVFYIFVFVFRHWIYILFCSSYNFVLFYFLPSTVFFFFLRLGIVVKANKENLFILYFNVLARSCNHLKLWVAFDGGWNEWVERYCRNINLKAAKSCNCIIYFTVSCWMGIEDWFGYYIYAAMLGDVSFFLLLCGLVGRLCIYYTYAQL